jgi:hypothetical protein
VYSSGRSMLGWCAAPSTETASPRGTSWAARSAIAMTAQERELLSRVDGELTGADVDACMRVLTNMRAALDEIEPDG